MSPLCITASAAARQGIRLRIGVGPLHWIDFGTNLKVDISPSKWYGEFNPLLLSTPKVAEYPSSYLCLRAQPSNVGWALGTTLVDDETRRLFGSPL